jgi:hypothetical protein
MTRLAPNKYFDLAPDATLVLRFLGWLTYFMLLASFLVDGLLPQVQMLLTGGSTPLQAKSRLFLVLLVLASVLVARRVRNNPLSNAHIVLAAFMCVDFGVLYATTGYPALDIFAFFNWFLFPLVLCGLILSAPVTITQRDLLTLGLLVFIPCVGISALQFITNSPVLPTQSRDQSFAVQSYVFFDRTRAFSLFSSALGAGSFYCIPAAIGIILILSRRRILSGSLLLLLSLLASYATYTRLAILGVAASVFSAIIIANVRLSRLAKILPVLWCVLAFATISIGSLGSTSRTNEMTNTMTLDERLSDWRFYGNRYVSGTLTEMLFGTGMTEYVPADQDQPRFSSAAPSPIDNAFLQILLHSGALLLGGVVYFYFQAWRSLCYKATQNRQLFDMAAAAVFSTTPFFAAINDLPVPMFALFTLAMMTENGHSSMSYVKERPALFAHLSPSSDGG